MTLLLILGYIVGALITAAIIGRHWTQAESYKGGYYTVSEGKRLERALWCGLFWPVVDAGLLYLCIVIVICESIVWMGRRIASIHIVQRIFLGE